MNNINIGISGSPSVYSLDMDLADHGSVSNWIGISANGTGPTFTSTITSSPWLTQENGKIQIEGDAEFKGDIKIKGKSLTDSLASIEDRLAILHPNPELEEKWENLRCLRKMYMDLEKEILEQEKILDILNR